jgi:hypothetical protein
MIFLVLCNVLFFLNLGSVLYFDAPDYIVTIWICDFKYCYLMLSWSICKCYIPLLLPGFTRADAGATAGKNTGEKIKAV